MINCAGLFSDRISRMAGERPEVQIVPFRGEYYDLVPERADLVRALIYPVPDPRFPFLGRAFHAADSRECGCGAECDFCVQARRVSSGDFSLRDTVESLMFPGFWRVAAKHWRRGKDEMRRSVSKASFVAGLQRLVPDDEGGGSGAGRFGRAGAGDSRGRGALVDDFQFTQSKHMLHLYNVPSPAATASIAIGRGGGGDGGEVGSA